MKIVRHDELEKDFKKLKKYPAPKESLESWERLFCLKGIKETPKVDRYPGFGEKEIYKARVVPMKENIGKYSGYRVIFQVIKNSENDSYRILFFYRHEIYKNEREIILMIRERLL